MMVLVLLGFGAGTLIALLGMLMLWRRLVRQNRMLQDMQNDLRALCNAAMGMGERVGQMERRLRQLGEQQEALGLRQEQLKQSDPESRSYAQAIKLVHKGAGVEDLMELCGLSRGEAELVSMMHRLENQ